MIAKLDDRKRRAAVLWCAQNSREPRSNTSVVQRLRGPVASPTPPLAQPLTELRVELEDVVQREEEEGDGVAEEL